MLTEEKLAEAIQAMRRTGPDRLRWELAEASADFPKSLLETVSAFANAKGGRIILGLSEKAGFRPVKEFDADRILSQAQAMGERMTPALQQEVEKISFEGSVLVVAEVQPLPAAQMPCCITALDRYAGAFLRTADGNRRLTAYEVNRLLEAGAQPKYDLEPVEEADASDLDPDKLEQIVLRCRELFPRVFGTLAKEQSS